jgi:hypothetical protein
MIKDGSWTLPQPGAEQLAGIFVSKTIYHDKYQLYFPLVPECPQIEKWLQGALDAPSNITIFGKEKHSYNFMDLEEAFERFGKKIVKKESKKRKVKESSEESEKSSDEEMEEEKRKKKGKGKGKKRGKQ